MKDVRSDSSFYTKTIFFCERETLPRKEDVAENETLDASSVIPGASNDVNDDVVEDIRGSCGSDVPAS